MDAFGADHRYARNSVAADALGVSITNNQRPITNSRHGSVPARHAADVPLLYPIPRRNGSYAQIASARV